MAFACALSFAPAIDTVSSTLLTGKAGLQLASNPTSLLASLFSRTLKVVQWSRVRRKGDVIIGDEPGGITQHEQAEHREGYEKQLKRALCTALSAFELKVSAGS
jgi:hypothetical protein